jgi:hypothetical protein
MGAVVDALRPLGVSVDVATVFGAKAKLAVDNTGPPPPDGTDGEPALSTGPPTAMLPLGPTRTRGGALVAANKLLGVTTAAKVNAGVAEPAT